MIKPLKHIQNYDKSRAFYLLAKFLLNLILVVLLLMAIVNTAVIFGWFDTKALGKTTAEPLFVTAESTAMAKAKEELINSTTVTDKVIEEPIAIPFDDILAELPIEQRIKNVCEYYKVPYDLALAIARLETGWFKSNAYINKNNVGGMISKGKLMSFNSLNEGVEAFISNLSRNYIKLGLDTPEKIGKKYCPFNAEWPEIIRKLMRYE